MSSSDLGTGRIELASSMPSLELSVVASDFRPVASAMGRLAVDVPPGIYQLVARAGPVVERKLIRVDAGSVYGDTDVTVRYPASAPVTDTTTSHDYQQHAAEQASSSVAGQTGPPSGLVIVVRDTRGREGPPLEPGDVAVFDLLDQSLTPIAGFAEGWQIVGSDACATWSGRLPPGGYALRTDPARAPGGERTPAIDQPFDQSVWLSEHWQTIVFITTGPGGPRTSAASIHMCALGIGWSMYDSQIVHGLELANWGLREGRSVVPDHLLSGLLNTKFINPMLGIVGAHALLLRENPDRQLLDVVLGNLDRLVPTHPDVLALHRMADSGAAPTAATWPPMLLPGYRALVQLDAEEPGTIHDGSPAERVAGNLVVQGIWTTWRPLAAPRLEDAPRAGGPAAGGGPPSLAPAADGSAAVLAAIASNPALIERVALHEPATMRVAGYLAALAALEGSRRGERFASLTPEEIARATTLPVVTVGRALAELGTVVPPPPPAGSGSATGDGGDRQMVRPQPGPAGGGLIGTLLPFVAAGALLLGGAAAAIEWCAGNDACPVEIGRPAATEPAVAIDGTPAPPILAPPTLAPPTRQPVPSPTATEEPEPTPPPTASPEPTPVPLDLTREIDFGLVIASFGAGQQPLTVLAPGPVDLTFTLTDNPDQAFTTQPTCEWVVIDPSASSCTVAIDFVPPRLGDHAGVLEVHSTDQPAPIPVALSGQGVELRLAPPEVLDFGSATIDVPDPLTAFMASDATPPVTLVVVDDPAMVFQAEPSCPWLSRTGGAPFFCRAGVTFTPKELLSYKATLEIWLGGPIPRTIQLVGHGDPGLV